jgi:hypothetical protein
MAKIDYTYFQQVPEPEEPKRPHRLMVFLVLFLIAVAILFFCLAAAKAATISAKSLSQSDVQSAIDSAKAGDTVQIPAGSSTWGGVVRVTKPLKIVGASASSTTLHNSTSGDNNALFQVTLGTDQRIEIAAMTLVSDVNNGSVGVILLNGNALLTQIVLHDLVFNKQKFAIMNGTVGDPAGFGVMYDCTFNNVKIVSRQAGFHNTGMFHGVNIPSPAWGTNFYFVYEDCIFNYTSGFYPFYSGDTEGPMNYMVRHCTLNISGSGSDQSGFDEHGDNSGGGINAFLNTQGYILHDNTWSMPGGYVIDKLSDTRGGVGNLIFNNSSTGGRFSRNLLRANAFSNDTTSSAPQKTYFDNNKSNGVLMGDPQVDTNPVNSNPNVTIKKGVNYFVNQGLPSGYTEIAYPHPLRAGGTPVPTPTPPSVADGATLPIGIGANAFILSTAGTYKLIGTVTAPSGDKDSLWIDFDSDPTGDDTRAWDMTPTTAAAEQTVKWRGTNQAIDPKTWVLTSGAHTLNIAPREPAGISQVKFVAVSAPSPSPAPTVIPSPTPSPGAPTYKNWELELNKATNQWIDVHPPIPD